MDPHFKRVEQELTLFKSFKQNLKNNFDVHEFDEYGFSICSSEKVKHSILFTGLVHGDEIVGLEAINLVLNKISGLKTDLKIGFLLCNIPAALKKVRYVESDLNRSFLISSAKTLEEKRAKEIESIVGDFNYVIDSHQTVEPTQTPFYIFEHNLKLIKLAYQLDAKLPIVTFPSLGFSHSGKTLLEFATTKNLLPLSIEWGEKGFSQSQSKQAADFILNTIQKIDTGIVDIKAKIKIYHLTDFIKNVDGAKLLPGLVSYLPIKKNQELGFTNEKPILSPLDGRLFFPKYGALADASYELCELGVAQEIML